MSSNLERMNESESNDEDAEEQPQETVSKNENGQSPEAELENKDREEEELPSPTENLKNENHDVEEDFPETKVEEKLLPSSAKSTTESEDKDREEQPSEVASENEDQEEELSSPTENLEKKNSDVNEKPTEAKLAESEDKDSGKQTSEMAPENKDRQGEQDIDEEFLETNLEKGPEEQQLPSPESPRIDDADLQLFGIECEDKDSGVQHSEMTLKNEDIREEADVDEELPETILDKDPEEPQLPLVGSPRIAELNLDICGIESEDEDINAVPETELDNEENFPLPESYGSDEHENEVFEEEPQEKNFEKDLEQQQLPLAGSPRVAAIEEERKHCGRQLCLWAAFSVAVIVVIVLVVTILGPVKSDNEVKMAEGLQHLDEPLCPSLYKVGGHNEHSPVVFEREQVVVCRIPQAGTKFLRDLTVSYVKTNITSFPPEESMHTGFQHINPTLDKVESVDEFHHYLFGDQAQRVMVVRHPVTRILAGFYEIASSQPDEFWKTLYGFEKSHGSDPQAFEFWLRHSTFVTEDYHAQCTGGESTSKSVLEESLNPQFQEWAPAQHCRCGIQDCGVEWTVYKMEEFPVYKAIANYLPSLQRMIVKKKLAKDNVMETYTEDQFDANDYLTDDVLDILNPLTREEQEFFGYEPYQSKKIYSL